MVKKQQVEETAWTAQRNWKVEGQVAACSCLNLAKMHSRRAACFHLSFNNPGPTTQTAAAPPPILLNYENKSHVIMAGIPVYHQILPDATKLLQLHCADVALNAIQSGTALLP